MLTYFIRHTEKLDIDGATLERLWRQHCVAIHYPHYAAKPNWRSRDNASLKADNYPNGNGRKEMRILRELAANGGYVCAEFRGHQGCLVGLVPPNTHIKLMTGAWGIRHGYTGRRAILKTLKLKRAK